MIAQKYQDCIDACQVCAVSCDNCLEADLRETDHLPMLANCIRLNRDCAKLCYTSVTFMASDSLFAHQVCELCAQVCDACAEECEKHAQMHDHCRECAEACRRCAEACRNMVAMAA